MTLQESENYCLRKNTVICKNDVYHRGDRYSFIWRDFAIAVVLTTEDGVYVVFEF